MNPNITKRNELLAQKVIKGLVPQHDRVLRGG